MTKLAGKMALVTGGSRGIRAAVARRLAADGAAVTLTSANGAAQAADVAQSIEDKGGRTVVIHADHADPPAAARAAAGRSSTSRTPVLRRASTRLGNHA
jgi:3-oxoacyl-[acyl-carrier protein] reductase